MDATKYITSSTNMGSNDTDSRLTIGMKANNPSRGLDSVCWLERLDCHSPPTY